MRIYIAEGLHVACARTDVLLWSLLSVSASGNQQPTLKYLTLSNCSQDYVKALVHFEHSQGYLVFPRNTTQLEVW